jgi:hypothetical protein
MNISNSYVCIYNFLSYITQKKYAIIGENIESMLSDMDPFIWQADENNLHISGDPAMAIEWKEDLVRLNGKKDEYNSKEVFSTLLQYLERYKDAFEIQNVIDFLNEMQQKPEQYKKYWQWWEESMRNSGGYEIDFNPDI